MDAATADAVIQELEAQAKNLDRIGDDWENSLEQLDAGSQYRPFYSERAMNYRHAAQIIHKRVLELMLQNANGRSVRQAGRGWEYVPE